MTAISKLLRNLPDCRSFATLHPMMKGLSDEIRRVFDLGIIGFKLSSFSQRFDLDLAGSRKHAVQASKGQDRTAEYARSGS